VDQSLGAIGDITTSASFTSRGGYPGQLTEGTNLILTSPIGTNISEAGTFSLLALVANNDGTVGAASAAWSTLTGPVFSLGGGAFSWGAVYVDTGATVQAAAGGLTGTLALLIQNTDPDNYGLYAGDNVDDAWQVQYFGTNNALGLGTADPDHDGQNNKFEYLALTSPLSATSRFDVAIAYLNATNRVVTFQPRQTNRTYLVEQSAALTGWSNLVSATTNDVTVVRSVTDRNATQSRKFYRVRITVP
jgi:hypothetical protein